MHYSERESRTTHYHILCDYCEGDGLAAHNRADALADALDLDWEQQGEYAFCPDYVEARKTALSVGA